MITADSHLPAALSSPNVDLVALVDPERDRASKLADDYGVSLRIEQYIEAVLDDVDGVIVATPNHAHLPVALACIERDVSVLIEKPLANSIEDCCAISKAAEKANCCVCVGYVTRFWPNVQLLGRLLKDNYFGRVSKFAHQYGTPGGWAPVSGYILNKEEAGGGVLTVTGSHFVDRMLRYWGYPTQVSYFDDSRGGPEANCEAFLTFEHDGHVLEGYLRYSKTVSLPKGLVLETEKGTVLLRDDPESRVLVNPANNRDLWLAVTDSNCNAGYVDPFALQLENFVQSSLEKSPAEISVGQGQESVKLITEMYAFRQQFPSDWYGKTCG